MIRKCLIKESVDIRKYLLQRFDQLELSGRDVVRNAREIGKIINEAALSRYLRHGNVKGTISQEDVLWLATRYCIPVKIGVGAPYFDGKRIKWTLPPYNEKNALKQLK